MHLLQLRILLTEAPETFHCMHNHRLAGVPSMRHAKTWRNVAAHAVLTEQVVHTDIEEAGQLDKLRIRGAALALLDGNNCRASDAEMLGQLPLRQLLRLTSINETLT